MKPLLQRLFRVTLVATMLISAYADVPPPPQNLQYSWANGTAIVLTWPAVNATDGYKVYRFNELSAAWEPIASVVEPFFRETPATTAGIRYAISSVNGEGESALTEILTSEAAEADFMISLYQPDFWFGTVSPTGARIAWAGSPVSGVDGILEVGTSEENLTFIGWHPEYQGYHSFEITNLTPGSLYYYRVTTADTNRHAISTIQSFYTMPPNTPPTADNVTVPYSGGSTRISLSGSDADYPPAALSFRIVAPPAQGTLSDILFSEYGEPYVYYAAAPGARNSDTFEFVVNDGEADSLPATGTITGIFSNRPPVVGNSTETTPEDIALQFTLPGSDPDGDALVFFIDSVSGGTISGSAPNITWRPPTNFFGQLSLTYHVLDSFGAPAVGRIDLTVQTVNDAPVANPQSLWTTRNTPLGLLLSGSDIEGGPIFYQVLGCNYGMVSGQGANTTYTPPPNWTGTDRIAFRVHDGSLSSPTEFVTILVEPPGPLPPPSGLVATPVSRTQINLSWQDNSTNEQGFKIERLNGAAWSQIATVGPNIRTYSNGGLSPNTVYSYRVRAYNPFGNSTPSNPAAARTLP